MLLHPFKRCADTVRTRQIHAAVVRRLSQQCQQPVDLDRYRMFVDQGSPVWLNQCFKLLANSIRPLLGLNDQSVPLASLFVWPQPAANAKTMTLLKSTVNNFFAFILLPFRIFPLAQRPPSNQKPLQLFIFYAIRLMKIQFDGFYIRHIIIGCRERHCTALNQLYINCSKFTAQKNAEINIFDVRSRKANTAASTNSVGR